MPKENLVQGAQELSLAVRDHLGGSPRHKPVRPHEHAPVLVHAPVPPPVAVDVVVVQPEPDPVAVNRDAGGGGDGLRGTLPRLAADARLRVCLCLYAVPYVFFLYKATRGP